MRDGAGSGSGPPAAMSSDERVSDAWRAWLSALATEPEVAIAAALSYEALDAVGRTRWLDALEQDAPLVHVPKLALYAPLLSVETDPSRRARIEAAVTSDSMVLKRPAGRALRAVTGNGDRIVVIVLPLYLDFVHLLACRFRLNEGFIWVRSEPMVRDCDAPHNQTELDGVGLEATPLKSVVEELAHAIVAHRRSGQDLPNELSAYVDLFRLSADDEA